MLYTVKVLARVADRQGMWARDLKNHPHLLSGSGLDVEDITPAMEHAADEYNREQVEAIIRRSGANCQTSYAERTSTESKPQERGTLFGFPITSVIRWMGKEGWGYTKAFSALEALGVDANESTVRTQLAAGRKGQRGEPAPLTRKQIVTINLVAD